MLTRGPLAHATWHVTWPFGTLSTHNMGGYECKTWQGGKKTQNSGQKGKIFAAVVLFVLNPLTSMGICKVRVEWKHLSSWLPQRNSALPLTSTSPSILCQTLEVAKFVCVCVWHHGVLGQICVTFFMSDLEVAKFVWFGFCLGHLFVVGEEECFKSVWECK
jgi:hypothetical protein